MKKILAIIFYLIIMSACEKQGSKTIENTDPSIYAIKYGEHPLQSFTLHTPMNADNTTKVAILIHGGGWVMGYHPDESVTTFTGRYNWDIHTPLLEAGIAVLTMKYRTACYNTQPDKFDNDTRFYIDRMIEDINLVIDNLKDNKDTYNVNPSDIHLVGESGGGHIAMYYGIQSSNRSEVKSVVSMFGPTDLDADNFKTIVNDVPVLPVSPPNYFLRQAENCTSVSNVSVKTIFSLKSFSDHHEILIDGHNPFLDTLSTTYLPNIKNNIPFFVTHGVEDELVPYDQAESMVSALESAYGENRIGEENFNGKIKLGRYENCGHGWTGSQCNRNKVVSDIVTWVTRQ